tara:strand:- start:43 stop:243 length:201 start_codon:yes stop_codon:yes gene_type:complete
MKAKSRDRMIKAYIKGLDIISSCKNSAQVMVTFNWIDNFRKLYGNTKETKKLMEKCSKKRKNLDLV